MYKKDFNLKRWWFHCRCQLSLYHPQFYIHYNIYNTPYRNLLIDHGILVNIALQLITTTSLNIPSQAWEIVLNNTDIFSSQTFSNSPGKMPNWLLHAYLFYITLPGVFLILSWWSGQWRKSTGEISWWFKVSLATRKNVSVINTIGLGIAYGNQPSYQLSYQSITMYVDCNDSLAFHTIFVSSLGN